MIKILLAEDEKELNNFICTSLQNEGFDVTVCFNGKEAYEKLQNQNFDLLLSDIMMPLMDGFSLAEKTRKITKTMPIVFLTAKDDKLSKQFGYNLGIDDYIVKPFDIDELIYKIRAILRRANISVQKVISIGNLLMNQDEHSAYLNGEELLLTVREFDILFKLLSYPKKTFTRSALMNEFWDYDSSATSRTVDVCVAKLRDKTANCNGFEIVTVHGLGYKAVINETVE